MKQFAGNVRVLAEEERGGAIMRAVLKLLGSGEEAEKKGKNTGFTRGTVITDHVRQEMGMAVFDTFSKMLMLGLVENPEPPGHKTDVWRLTALGNQTLEVVLEEEHGPVDVEDAPTKPPADAKIGRRKTKAREEGGD